MPVNDDNDNELSDNYVATLLKQDAERNAKWRYSGLSNGSGPRPAAHMKPNTRFFRNIVRETDNHNAALAARNAAEARKHPNSPRERRARNEGVERRRQDGLRRGDESDRRSQRKTDERAEEQERRRTRIRERSSEDNDRRRRKGEHHRSRSRSRYRSRSRSPRKRTEHHRQDDGRHKHYSNRSPRGQARRYRSISSSRPSDHPRDHPVHSQQHESPTSTSQIRHQAGTDVAMHESEELVDALIGPEPPARGRGAHSGISKGIDARFDPNYDPRQDVALDDPSEDDDWSTSLEALRARTAWRATGAERMRAAGFSEAQVRTWQGTSGEDGKTAAGLEEKIRWSRVGESREWDRGKIIEGDFVDMRPAWARKADL